MILLITVSQIDRLDKIDNLHTNKGIYRSIYVYRKICIQKLIETEIYIWRSVYKEP